MGGDCRGDEVRRLDDPVAAEGRIELAVGGQPQDERHRRRDGAARKTGSHDEDLVVGLGDGVEEGGGNRKARIEAGEDHLASDPEARVNSAIGQQAGGADAEAGGADVDPARQDQALAALHDSCDAQIGPARAGLVERIGLPATEAEAGIELAVDRRDPGRWPQQDGGDETHPNLQQSPADGGQAPEPPGAPCHDGSLLARL